MKPFLSLHTPTITAIPPLFFFPQPSPPLPRFIKSSSAFRTNHSAIHSLPTNSTSQPADRIPQEQHQPRRTLYPGGYKRPEIKVPTLVLQLEPDEVLGSDGALEVIDEALAKWVGIVVLNDGGGGGRLYDAACVLKSLIKDRAYFLIAERVDIAAAVNASGVVLSDQGLPAIVARNTMLGSKSDSVVLPLVARIVQTTDAAINASYSEGADFLICGSFGGENVDAGSASIFNNVKLPVFSMHSSRDQTSIVTEASLSLKSGASGLVISLKDLMLFSDDVLSQLFTVAYPVDGENRNEPGSFNKSRFRDDASIEFEGEKRSGGFVKLEDREKGLIEKERSILLEAINIIKKAAPLMEEVSLLMDAVSQIDKPFLMVIVGEFNSGKSTVINALLGQRYLKDGVIPTTNEITFLSYSELDSEELHRCERPPDGQYICYLPAPILKDMNIVDTPGTNVILQRQQRLTEEFLPRADLLLFVISADRPLTESEVAFLRYTQQWKKKVVFVLNKSDIYRTVDELQEAISFIKENTRKLLNTEQIILYPISARSALEEKISVGKNNAELSDVDSHWRTYSFHELEKFLYSFLDGSTNNGMERMKLKLETPIVIAERFLSASDSLVRQECEYAKQELAFANKIIASVDEYAMKMENESVSWRKRALSLIDVTKSRTVKLIESSLQVSNFNLAASYMLKGENSATTPITSKTLNEILGPALSDSQGLLREYAVWLQSNSSREGRLYKESFDNKWPSFVTSKSQIDLETYDLLKQTNELSLKVINNLSASATSELLDQEIREAFLGTFSGLGAAGLSASLLTSVLPTTSEDLLALGLCSAGGYIAISNFPARRRAIIQKVNRIADSLASQVEEAMQKDLAESVSKLQNFVKMIGKPYQEEAEHKIEKLLSIQDEISVIEKNIKTLRVEIQNLHVS